MAPTKIKDKAGEMFLVPARGKLACASKDSGENGLLTSVKVDGRGEEKEALREGLGLRGVGV